jgi:ABC-type xylose transport system permease subunit
MSFGTIGGLIGYVAACILFGQKLPLISAPAFMGIFIGLVIGSILGQALMAAQASAGTSNDPSGRLWDGKIPDKSK